MIIRKIKEIGLRLNIYIVRNVKTLKLGDRIIMMFKLIISFALIIVFIMIGYFLDKKRFKHGIR